MNITNYERNRGKSVTIFKGRVNIVVTFLRFFIFFLKTYFSFQFTLKDLFQIKILKFLSL